MSLRFRLFSIIPLIGLGGLFFIGLIAYQNIGTFTAVKQQELLQEYSELILLNHPANANKNDWVEWLKKTKLITSSSFITILQGTNGRIISRVKGHNTKADVTFAGYLANELSINEFPEQYTSHKGLRYIWYKIKIPDTSYSLLLIHASVPATLTFYFKYLGIPVIFAAIIILWISLWLSLILSNLYQRLDKQKKIMEHSAYHDSLTNLPNRALFNDRLNQIIKTAKRDNSCFAICMLDLDRFKEINDALGHDCGDKLLVEVSARIKSMLREVDTIARIGGDEFSIILYNTEKKRAIEIVERISENIRNEFIIDDEKFHISGSIGVALYPDHSLQEDTLLKYADLTMYHAKKHNYNYAVFDPKKDNIQKNSLFLYSDLIDAKNNNHFEIFYQPKLDLPKNKITSAEALIRWKHPQQGYILPDNFIPIAEQTGLIRDITRWLIETVIQDIAFLKKLNIDISISINFSVHDLDEEDICDYIFKLTRKYGVSPKNIIIEVTESAMIFNPTVTDKILGRLNDMGFIVSIDDFGTGFSSLSNLQRLHIKEIKIDQTFIVDIQTNKNNHRIVRGTIRLAHDLGMKVVAEGVETKEILDILSELDCDIIQGYKISKPLPLSQLDKTNWNTTENTPSA